MPSNLAYGVRALNPHGFEAKEDRMVGQEIAINNSLGEATSLLAYGLEILGIKRKSDVRLDFGT